MIYDNIEDFKKNILKNKRIVGLDIGRKTIGVALSDRDKNIATPKLTISRKSTIKDIEILKKYITENDVCAIVSGLPLNFKEEEIKECNYIKTFIKSLESSTKLPIYFSNEFLTSFDAEDTLIDKMNNSFEKTKKLVDKVAASIILREVLDKIK